MHERFLASGRSVSIVECKFCLFEQDAPFNAGSRANSFIEVCHVEESEHIIIGTDAHCCDSSTNKRA